MCLLIAEFVCFIVTTYEDIKYANSINDAIKQEKDKYSYKIGYHILKDYPENNFDSSAIKNSKKNPILWFGCSFAAGVRIIEHRSYPCDKISDLTCRSCINRAQSATGTQYIYNQLITNDFKKIAPEVDFIIYTYISDHKNRLYTYKQNIFSEYSNIRYEYKNNKLVKISPLTKYLYVSFLIQRIKNIQIKYQKQQEQIYYNLFNHTIAETTKKLKELYPNAKFIMIEFNQKEQAEPRGQSFIPNYEIEKLNSYGIEVFKIRDYVGNINLSDDKYWQEDNVHPSTKLWDIIIPELVKKYNI